MLRSWDELIKVVGPRPGMFVGRARYSLVRSFVEGFAAGRDDEILWAFQRWLSDQPQHCERKNYAWWALLLDELFPDRRRVITPAWVNTASPLAAAWPRPPAAPIAEDDLVYPEEDEAAIRHLFARLQEFLNDSPDTEPQDEPPTASAP